MNDEDLNIIFAALETLGQNVRTMQNDIMAIKVGMQRAGLIPEAPPLQQPTRTAAPIMWDNRTDVPENIFGKLNKNK